MTPTHMILRPLVAISMAGSAFAGPTAEPVVIPPSPTPDSGWEFRIEPYAWLTGLNGNISRGPLTLAIDQGFSDIVDDLNMAAALQMEARNGCWGIMFDGFYADIGTSAETMSPLYGEGKVGLKQILVELDLAYRLHETPRSFIDLFAGVRYNSLRLDLSAATNDPSLAPAISETVDRGWADPLIGVRGQWNISDRWFIAGRGDIGGFGIESDFAWNVQATVGYQFTDTFSTELGYRYFDTDYRDGDFEYDIAEHGLFIGFNFTF